MFMAMENSNKIIPPHLNAEVYRTDTTGTKTVSFLDYLRLHKDGSMLVGCSELTGRYWNGSVSVFESVIEGQKLHREQKNSITITSGTADGCFIEKSSKVFACEDSGAVSVWSNSEDAWKMWSLDVSAAEHDDACLGVDCLVPGTEYVTIGADGNIKVWDINEMICIRNYNAAHTMAISGIAVKPQSSTCFATSSLDQYMTLWDDNISKSVIDLATNDCGIRCLQWLDENRIVYGDEAGVLRLVDVRNSEDVVKLCEFPAAVHKLAVHSESPKVAVCCDNKIVSVCEISGDGKSHVVYHDRHMHSNYVRGVAWDPQDLDQLHSLGWDGVPAYLVFRDKMMKEGWKGVQSVRTDIRVAAPDSGSEGIAFEIE